MFKIPIIPRGIHRVWVGSPPPSHVLDNWTMWSELFPDLTFKHWTDESVTSLRAYEVLASLPKFEDPRVLSDYVRLAALLEFGGMYVDSDAVPLTTRLNPGYFTDPWIAAHRTKRYKNGLRILNGAICVQAKNPFLQKVFVQAIANARSGLVNAHKLAGPHVFMDLYDGSIQRLPIFDILYEAEAKKGYLAYLREASPLAPFVFLGE